MSKYDLDLELDNTNSTSLIIGLLKKNTTVLEFGPAHGRLTKYLKEDLGCTVDIIEIDPIAGNDAKKYARNFCIGEFEGDATKDLWTNKLRGLKYDYIIFEDVLEHLYKPKKILNRVKPFLNISGSILVSIPNIAHTSILVQLFNDKFAYQTLGLLDDTHIHLFTYSSFLNIVDEMGFVTVEEKATFSATESTEFHVNLDEVPSEVAKQIIQKQYSNAYQYVFELKIKEEAEQGKRLQDNQIDLNSRYFSQCYIKNKESQYLEGNSSKLMINPFQVIQLEFSLPKEEIEIIRIDPINSNCLLIVDEIIVFTNKGEKCKISNFESNGDKLEDKRYIFVTKDPQIYIDLSMFDDAEKIYINFRIEEFDSEKIEKMYSIWRKTKESYDKIIGAMDFENRNKNKALLNMDSAIKEKDSAIKVMDEAIKEKDNAIKVMDEAIKEKDSAIKVMDEAIKEKDSSIQNMNFSLQEKNRHILMLEEKLDENNKLFAKKRFRILKKMKIF